jgi:hypothetical protein
VQHETHRHTRMQRGDHFRQRCLCLPTARIQVRHGDVAWGATRPLLRTVPDRDDPVVTAVDTGRRWRRRQLLRRGDDASRAEAPADEPKARNVQSGLMPHHAPVPGRGNPLRRPAPTNAPRSPSRPAVRTGPAGSSDHEALSAGFAEPDSRSATCVLSGTIAARDVFGHVSQRGIERTSGRVNERVVIPPSRVRRVF